MYSYKIFEGICIKLSEDTIIYTINNVIKAVSPVNRF